MTEAERMPDCDPKNLIRECYRIDGITEAECRSILLDWALSLPDGADAPALIPALLARHGEAAPDHPMTALLREGLGEWKGARRGHGRRRRKARRSPPGGAGR